MWKIQLEFFRKYISHKILPLNLSSGNLFPFTGIGYITVEHFKLLFNPHLLRALKWWQKLLHNKCSTHVEKYYFNCIWISRSLPKSSQLFESNLSIDLNDAFITITRSDSYQCQPDPYTYSIFHFHFHFSFSLPIDIQNWS